MKQKPSPATDSTNTIEIHVLDSFNTVKQVFEGSGTFDNLIHDDITEQDILDTLSVHNGLFQISKGNEFAGFFSVDDLGLVCDKRVCEVHAYILPYMRRYSKDFLKVFADFIFELSNFDNIVTSVPEYCFLVGKVIKKIGFEELFYRENQYIKGQVTYGITHYILKK